MKRWAALALLLLLPLTLAPRTSDVLNNGWSYVVHAAGSAPAETSTFVASMWRERGQDPIAVVKVAIEPQGAWELVAASPGCVADVEDDEVSCLVDATKIGQKQVVAVTVRTTTGGPASFKLSSGGTTG